MKIMNKNKKSSKKCNVQQRNSTTNNIQEGN